MTLEEFHGLLCSVCENVSHFYPLVDSLPRIIYAETGRNYYYADNKIKLKQYIVNVEFFTTTEYDPMFEMLEDVLSENMISFDLESIQMGEFSGQDCVIGYKLRCEV